MDQVRGSFIYGLRNYIVDNFPEKFYVDFLSRLSRESRATLEDMIISSRMYSLTEFQEIHAMFHEMAGEEKLFEYSRGQAESNLQGLFGLVARLISVETLIRRMGKMWSTAFSRGTISLKSREGDIAVVRIADFKFTPTHRLSTGAYIARIIELTERCKVSYDIETPEAEVTDYIFTMTKSKK